MNMFKKVGGSAISRLGSASAPGGGGGALPGDVRLFAEDPGSGWASEHVALSYSAERAAAVAPFIDTDAVPVSLSAAAGTGTYIAEEGGGVLLIFTTSANSIATQNWRSTDGGETWVQTSKPFNDVILRGLYYSKKLGVWFAYGSAGNIWRSADGLNWTKSASNPFGTEVVATFAEKDGLLLAQSADRLAISTNGGIDWTQTIAKGDLLAGSTPAIMNVTEANGSFFLLFHAGSSERRHYTSEDGQNWTQKPTPWSTVPAGQIIGFGGAYYTWNNSTLYRSVDLVTWDLVPVTVPVGFNNIRGIYSAYGVLALSYDNINTSYKGGAMASYDGEEWMPLQNAAISNGQYYNQFAITSNLIFLMPINTRPMFAPLRYTGVKVKSKPIGKKAFAAYTKL